MKKSYLMAVHFSLCIRSLYAAESASLELKSDTQALVNSSTTTEQFKVQNASTNKVYSFDTRSFFGTSQLDDGLIKISRWNSIAEGKYSLRTYVNDKSLGELLLEFKHLDASSSAVLCLDKKLLLRLDLKKDVLDKLTKKECLTIKELSSDAYYDYDQSTLSLNISLPMIITLNRPQGYIPTERFDKGVTAAHVRYQYSNYLNKRKDQQDSNTTYLSLNTGINFLGWNYQNNGYFDSEESKLKKYHIANHQLSTDIVKLSSRLTLGEFNTQTYSEDSASIRGVQLATDIGMLPASQQYYSPLIKGMANTNALVSIFQNGQKIFEKNVPAGIFEINDLNAPSGYGDLTVQVTENGGEKHNFTLPLQGDLNLTRVGQFNYSAALGHHYLSNAKSDDHIAQLSAQYGLTNNLTLYGGTSYSQLYRSYHLGTGINSALGAFRVEANQTRTNPYYEKIYGEKYKILYQYNYLPLGTQFIFQSSFQTKKYMNMAHFFSQSAYDYLNQAELDRLYKIAQLKSEYNLSLSQRLKDPKYGVFYANASMRDYWVEKNNDIQYGLNYSNSWKKIYYSLGMSQSNSINLKNDTRYQLNLTFPLDIAKKRLNLNSNIQLSNTDGYPISTSLGFSGTAGESNQLSYSVSNNSTWSETNNSSSLSTGLNYNFSQFNIGLSSSLSDQDQQYGVNLSGGVVAHAYGVTLANSLSDTFTIIRAQDAKGARLDNSFGGKVDRFGNAIYNNVSPYSSNSIALDIRDLPVDINLKSNQSEVIPRRFSSTLLEFDTEQISNIILNLKLKDASKVAMGTQVKDEKDQVIGVFGQSNQLFIKNIKFMDGKKTIFWGIKNISQCRIDFLNKIKKSEIKNKQFEMLDVECIG